MRRQVKVISAEPAGEAEFYDFHVPGFENYWAGGLWHHNCGKSLVAKCVGRELGLPVLRCDVSGLLGSHYGESERNVKRALGVGQAAAPAVMWFDEIDKGAAGSRSDGSLDSGTTLRWVGSILTFMQERDPALPPLFFLMTGNRVKNLPPELLRKGRLDEIFFVDLPTRWERLEVLGVHVRKRGLEPKDRKAWDAVVFGDGAKDYSGAEIEAALEEARFEAWADGRRQVTAKDFETALLAQVPLARANAEEIGELRVWGRTRARPASEPEDEAGAEEAAPAAKGRRLVK